MASPVVLAPGVAECPSNQMDDAGLHHRVGKTALTDCGNPLRPSQTKKKTSATPRFFNSVSTASQYLADSPSPSPAHMPSTSR